MCGAAGPRKPNGPSPKNVSITPSTRRRVSGAGSRPQSQIPGIRDGVVVMLPTCAGGRPFMMLTRRTVSASPRVVMT